MKNEKIDYNTENFKYAKKLMKEKGIRILDVNWNKFKSKEDIENFIEKINQGIAILVED